MQSESEIILEELRACPMGDSRRHARAARLTGALVANSGRSLAQKCGSSADAKACYRLLANDAVSHTNLLFGHRQKICERSLGRRVVLTPQDTTTFSFEDRAPIEGMGPVDSALSQQGFFAHTALMVDPEADVVLGVAAQEVWARAWTCASKTETSAERKERARESEHWARVQCEVARAFGREQAEDGSWSPLPADSPRVIAVFDREGDVFEAMEQLVALDHGFVIRAVRDRKLKATEGRPSQSFNAVEFAPELGRVPFTVPRRPGQEPRQVTLSIRSAEMQLSTLKSVGRKGTPLPVRVVLVREEDPPEGVEPVVWYLLTTEPCGTLAEALTVITWYRYRWRVEELHMGLKTGCGVEQAQLERLEGLEKLLALASVATWRLLALRDAARRDEEGAPPEVHDDTQKAILRSRFPRLPSDPTAREWLRAVAMLGGFMGRKSQEPGWRTLWWGWQRLELLAEGWKLAARGGRATARG